VQVNKIIVKGEIVLTRNRQYLSNLSDVAASKKIF